MPIIEHQLFVQAPIEVCFDLTRDIGVHTRTTGKTKEKAIAGVTEGLIEEGESVTWEAVHFGIKQNLTAKITKMDRPYQFVDVMVKGAFHSFTHTHTFIEKDGGTVMIDHFDYRSPLGLLGVIADKLFLENYMREFLKNRALELKKIAEAPKEVERDNV